MLGEGCSFSVSATGKGVPNKKVSSVEANRFSQVNWTTNYLKLTRSTQKSEKMERLFSGSP
jgi:hypothetical protein